MSDFPLLLKCGRNTKPTKLQVRRLKKSLVHAKLPLGFSLSASIIKIWATGVTEFQMSRPTPIAQLQSDNRDRGCNLNLANAAIPPRYHYCVPYVTEIWASPQRAPSSMPARGVVQGHLCRKYLRWVTREGVVMGASYGR